MTRRIAAFALGLGVALGLASRPQVAFAQGALGSGSLLQYVDARDDLSAAERAKWRAAIQVRFGGAALDEDTKSNPQIHVAKAIISAAIFMQADPKKAADAAFEGYRGALGYVPPPLAIHYQLLVLEGRKPSASQETLTFEFPEHYNEEVAPDMVAYWEKGLAEGTISDDILNETKEALAATRIKMRPLLADKLRLLAVLARERRTASPDRRKEIDRDSGEVEAELDRAFRGVAARPEVMDRSRTPFERLSLHLRAMGVPLSASDKALDPGPSAKADEQRNKEEARKAEEARKSEEARQRDERRRRTDDARRAAEEDEARRRADEERRRADEERRAQEERKRAEEQSHEETGDRGSLLRSPVLAVPGATIVPTLKTIVGAWLGTPYVWGGTTKRVGTDCSGFTQGVAAEGFGVALPRVSRDQALIGRPVAKEQLQPGDLIFFDTADMGHVNHVGVYAGSGKLAHASSTHGVMYDEFSYKYYQKAFRSARRILDPR